MPKRESDVAEPRVGTVRQAGGGDERKRGSRRKREERRGSLLLSPGGWRGSAIGLGAALSGALDK